MRSLEEVEREVREALARDEELGDRSYRHKHVLAVGDAVRVHGHDIYGKERPDEFEGKRYPAGREGMIVGYHVMSVCRFNRFTGLAPGIYQHPEWPLVRVGEWEVRQIRANYLSPVDGSLEARLARHRVEFPEFNRRHGPRLCDLPDTDVWEGDIVEFQSRPYVPRPLSKGKPFPGGFADRPDAFVVGWMGFQQHPGDLVESLDHLPRYSLSDRLFRRSGGNYYPFELDVVERGNLWRRAHGESTVFRDLAEETAFALRVGDARKARSTGAYIDRASGRAAAVKLVEAGEGDGILFYSTFCGWGSNDGYSILRFDDRSLGDRVREATLSSGFEVPSDEDDDPAE